MAADTIMGRQHFKLLQSAGLLSIGLNWLKPTPSGTYGGFTRFASPAFTFNFIGLSRGALISVFFFLLATKGNYRN